jgi:hypothetical protein
MAQYLEKGGVILSVSFQVSISHPIIPIRARLLERSIKRPIATFPKNKKGEP